jgi:hypothetical protein
VKAEAKQSPVVLSAQSLHEMGQDAQPGGEQGHWNQFQTCYSQVPGKVKHTVSSKSGNAELDHAYLLVWEFV